MGSLTMIGTGLNPPDDLTIRGIRACQAADVVFLESYTSACPQPIQAFSEAIGTRIITLTRREIEQEDRIITEASERDVAFLVLGDPLSATTHIELFTRARSQGIRTAIIHNTSILTAVATTGLELYKFGKTTSLAYPRRGFFPKTAYHTASENQKIHAHTLILLDIVTGSETAHIDVSRGNLSDMHRTYTTIREGLDKQPLLMMSPNEAFALLREIEKDEKLGLFTEETEMIVCSRLGTDEQICAGPLRTLTTRAYDQGPHALILPSTLHFVEDEALAAYRVKS